MTRYLLIILSLLCTSLLFSQKEISALRIDTKITLDGNLDEEIWKSAKVASDFTNWQPTAGALPSNKTEVKILYDNDAIYFGAFLHAKSKEEIQTELVERDNIGNTDWFGVVLDTYGNGTEAAEFIISSTGVQFDAKVTSNNGEDPAWNAIWESAVKILDNGWVVELKIPYSAIRFPKKDAQNWRVNFMRRMAGSGEKCSFQYIDPEVNGFINQTAFLRDVSNIKAPLRLSLSPYVSAYMLNNYDPNSSPSSTMGYSYNGGMDLKYGINEAFTLDMTLIPDFGQVQSDDVVLNLSPFEVQYNENRDFFTEGTDLFSRANIFYSRRVGGRPIGFWDVSVEEGEELLKNPQQTQLYNATKLSGRTQKGLGVGLFNAVAGQTEAEIRNIETGEKRSVETAPLTNYNVVVLDQNLPNNSFVSLINTNVWRQGDRYHNANVTGTEFDLKNKSQTYGVNGNVVFSQLLNPESDNVNGLKYYMEFGKISGEWRFELSASGRSRDYNNNDLGFNTRTNVKSYDAGVFYNINEGWKFLNRGTLWFNTFLGTRYEGNQFTSIHFNSGFWVQTKKQWTLNMWTNFRPESRDYFEPRVEGRYLRRKGFYNMGWWVGTDQRKKLWFGLYTFGLKRFEEGSHTGELSFEARYRFTDKFSMFFDTGIDKNYGSYGFVDFENDDDPIIANRDRTNYINVLGINYTINEKMSFNLRARHYWSKVVNQDFFGLDNEGYLTTSDYDQFNDFSFNSFNVDLNYTWRFAPGSDIIIVWKNNIFGLNGDEDVDFEKRKYSDGLKTLGDLPQSNSLSIRMIYYLDGQKLFR